MNLLYWHSPGEKIADTVIVKCLAGEQTCNRAWLLDRLKTPVATFEQGDHKALAAQYQSVIDLGLFSLSLITIGLVISAVALFNRYLPD